MKIHHITQLLHQSYIQIHQSFKIIKNFPNHHPENLYKKNSKLKQIINFEKIRKNKTTTT